MRRLISCIVMKLLDSGYPRRAWAATGIVVRWSVCLFVMCESTHLHAMALRLQHG